MDLYDEIKALRDIPSDIDYMRERQAVIDRIGLRAYLAISKKITQDNQREAMETLVSILPA